MTIDSRRVREHENRREVVLVRAQPTVVVFALVAALQLVP